MRRPNFPMYGACDSCGASKARLYHTKEGEVCVLCREQIKIKQSGEGVPEALEEVKNFVRQFIQ